MRTRIRLAKERAEKLNLSRSAGLIAKLRRRDWQAIGRSNSCQNHARDVSCRHRPFVNDLGRLLMHRHHGDDDDSSANKSAPFSRWKHCRWKHCLPRGNDRRRWPRATMLVHARGQSCSTGCSIGWAEPAKSLGTFVNRERELCCKMVRPKIIAAHYDDQRNTVRQVSSKKLFAWPSLVLSSLWLTLST